jgi:hypothetical protein
MKTNVSSNSLAAFEVIGKLMADQERKVLLSMDPGKTYTRRELGVLAEIENSAAARVVNGLIKNGDVLEVGTKRCSHSGYNVGAVTLSLVQAG